MTAGHFTSFKFFSVGFPLFCSEPPPPLLVEMTEVAEESCKACSAVIQISACAQQQDYLAVNSTYQESSVTL